MVKMSHLVTQFVLALIGSAFFAGYGIYALMTQDPKVLYLYHYVSVLPQNYAKLNRGCGCGLLVSTLGLLCLSASFAETLTWAHSPFTPDVLLWFGVSVFVGGIAVIAAFVFRYNRAAM